MPDAERGSFTLGARLRSFVYAARGLRALVATQHNAWIHLAATLCIALVGLALGLTRLEWCALVAAVALVWIAEALNTAVEAVCDLVSPTPHPLVERAKDVAAGAVLVAALAAAAIGALVLLPYFVSRG
jgi:diacylglycerol kinase (ATP)